MTRAVPAPKPAAIPPVPPSILAKAARDQRAAGRDAARVVPAPIPAANAAFPVSDASRAKQANAKWKAILADARPELADVDAPPRVKFIQTGKDCVDRTNFHEAQPRGSLN